MKHLISGRAAEVEPEVLRRLQYPGLALAGEATPVYGRFRSLDAAEGGGSAFAMLLQFETVPSYVQLHAGMTVELIASELRAPLRQRVAPAVIERRWQEPAARGDWQLAELSPDALVRVDYGALVTAAEYEWLMLGETPLSMDDKWFAFGEGDCLFYYRSWTGTLGFRLRFARAEEGLLQIVEALANPALGMVTADLIRRLIDWKCEEARRVLEGAARAGG